jgi:hypothetical protein
LLDYLYEKYYNYYARREARSEYKDLAFRMNEDFEVFKHRFVYLARLTHKYRDKWKTELFERLPLTL